MFTIKHADAHIHTCTHMHAPHPHHIPHNPWQKHLGISSFALMGVVVLRLQFLDLFELL